MGRGCSGEGVAAAVIDTGIAYEDYGEFRQVPDLKGAKFAPGYDFVNDTDHPDDDNGHGTHVAGTIAQVTNNGEGVAGVAPKAVLMPIKVLDADGFGQSPDIADAIHWAADHGAQVINMSLGGGGLEQDQGGRGRLRAQEGRRRRVRGGATAVSCGRRVPRGLRRARWR